MIVIKKSGKEETFSIDKLALSITAASDEAKEPLNKSDINRIVSEFQDIVQGKDVMSSHHIDIIVDGLLYSTGYYGVLDQYARYKKKR